jgi:hypothetical protein
VVELVLHRTRCSLAGPDLDVLQLLLGFRSQFRNVLNDPIPLDLEIGLADRNEHAVAEVVEPFLSGGYTKNQADSRLPKSKPSNNQKNRSI